MRWLVAGCVAVALAGLGYLAVDWLTEDKLECGTVTGKLYEPANTYVAFIPITMSCGKNCFTTTMIPYTVFDGEDYKLKLRDGERRGVAYVSPAEYERVHVGDFFNAKETADRNNRKERRG